MTEVQRLQTAMLANLSDPLVKLALADALEEQEDYRIVVNDHLWVWSSDYAYALRWLASRGKYPWRIVTNRDYHDHDFFRWHSQKTTGGRIIAALPQEIYSLLPIFQNGRAYADAQTAIAYLAEVLTRLRDVTALAPLPRV